MKTHILNGSQLIIPEVFDLANNTARAKLGSIAKRKILRASATSKKEGCIFYFIDFSNKALVLVSICDYIF